MAEQMQPSLNAGARVQPKKPVDPRLRKRRRRIILVSVLGLLGAGELTLRIVANRDSKFNIFLGAEKEFDPVRRTRWKKNYHAGDFKTNSRGFLSPEFEDRKAPGSFRIVCLGDSASVIPTRKNYPTALEARLRSLIPDRQIDVINASCSGYDSRQARSWYETEVDGIEHDMLLVYLGWNDMGQYHPEGLVYKKQETGYLREPSLFDKAILNVYLLRSIYVVRGFLEQRKAFSAEPLAGEELEKYSAFYPSHFEENILAIVRLAQSRGRTVRLLNYAGLVVENPTTDEQRRMHFPRGMGRRLPKYQTVMTAYEAALAKASRETGTPIIDIESQFADPVSREVFSDSAHFNERGSDVIAEFVADAIKSEVR